MPSEGQACSPTGAGARLREIRRQLGLSLRDVEAASRRIATKRGNREFYISNTRLAQLERCSVPPNIYKLASLSAICRTTLRVLLLSFGIDCDAFVPEPCPTPRTTLLGDIPQSMRASVGNAAATSPATRLLGSAGQLFERLVEQALAPSQGHRLAYGVVGTKDLTIRPLLQPGSGLIIDCAVRSIRKGPWQRELDRPLYLCEIRDGYTCSWCEEENGHVLVIPHPQSPCRVRRFAHPQEINVVGQVVAVVTRLAGLPQPAPAATAASALP